MHLNTLLLVGEITEALPARTRTFCWSESPSSSISHTKAFMSAHFPAHADERRACSMSKSSLSGLPAALKPVRVHLISFIFRYGFLNMMNGQNIYYVSSHSYTCKWDVWLHHAAACLFLASLFMGLASLFMIVSILLVSSFVSQRLSSSSPFIFVTVFLIWLLLNMQQEVDFIFQTVLLQWAESAFLQLIGQNETSLIRSSSLFDSVLILTS